MSAMVGYFAFKVLPALAALLLLGYLLSIWLRPAKRQTKIAKHKEGTPAYDFYSKLYGSKFLLGWSLITSFFVFSVAYDLYRSHRTHSLATAYFALAVSIATLSLGIFFIRSWAKK